MPDAARTPTTDDGAERTRVAMLLERAGLRLPADEIEALAKEYRKDRAAFERMRSLVALEDEPAHVFRAARANEEAGGSA